MYTTGPSSRSYGRRQPYKGLFYIFQTDYNYKMVLRLVVGGYPAQDEIGKLTSKVSLQTWGCNFDENESQGLSLDGLLEDPSIINARIPMQVPTEFSMKIGAEEIEESFKEYFFHFKFMILDRIKEMNEKITDSKSKANIDLISKRDRLQELAEEIDSNPEAVINLEGPTWISRYKTFRINQPFLGRKFPSAHLSPWFLFNSPYASAQRSTDITLNSPFSFMEIIDSKYDQSTVDDLVASNSEYSLVRTTEGPALLSRIRPEIEFLENQKALAIDFETENFEHIHVIDTLFKKKKPKVISHLEKVVEQYGAKMSASEIGRLTKLQAIYEIDRIVNENKDEQINSACLIGLKEGENYVITTLRGSADSISVERPDQAGVFVDVSVVYVDTQEELISEVNRIVQDVQPFYMYGHNHMTFDYRKAHRLDLDLRIGIDSEKPKRIGGIMRRKSSGKTTPIREHRRSAGRVEIDPIGYAHQYMNLRNNSLDVMFEHFTGVRSKKIMTYKELVEYTQTARKGDTKSADKIIYYCAQDGMKSYLICDALKREHLILSYATGSHPSRLDSTSARKIGEDMWVRRGFNRIGTYPKIQLDWQTQKLVQKKVFRTDAIKFGDCHPRDFLKGTVETKIGSKLPFKKGFQTCVAYQPFVIGKALKELMCIDDDVAKLYLERHLSHGWSRKARIGKAIEELCRFPLFQLLGSNHDKRIDRIRFTSMFELPPENELSHNNIAHFKKELWKYACNLSDVVEEHGLINYAKGVYLFPESASEMLCSLEGPEYHGIEGIIIGTGNSASIKRERVVYSIEGEVFFGGFQDPARAKRRRFGFENKIYEGFIEVVQAEKDTGAYYNELISAIGDFYSDGLDQSELAIEVRAQKDPKQYKTKAKIVQAMEDAGIRRGQFFRWEPSYDELIERFFGRSGSIREIGNVLFPRGTKEYKNLQKTYKGEF